MLRAIEPWLPPGFSGRVMKFVVVLVLVKLAIIVIVGVVLLILFAAGVI
jgi:hypothetical protein